MSAPESSSSKGRPSLLSEAAPGVANSNSRILASLEGRVVAQQPVRRRSKKPLVASVIAVLGFGAFGAWQWQHRETSEHPVVAQSSAAATAAPAKPLTAVGASAVDGGAAAVAAAGASLSASASASDAAATRTAQGEAASAPQPAVIVADDSVSGNPAAASSPAEADAGRLSRALASGAATGQGVAQVAQQPSSAAGPAAAPIAPAAASAAAVTASAAPKTASSGHVSKRTQAKVVASSTQHENAKARRSEKLAAAHPAKRAKVRAAASKDDPDADLLAALIARTKPYDAQAPHGASDASGKKASPAGAHTASLSDQVKACDKGNFFEAQTCRWHVCSDHWGKDPACPGAAPAAQAN